MLEEKLNEIPGNTGYVTEARTKVTAIMLGVDSTAYY